MKTPTFTVSEISSISNHKEVLRNLKTLIINTVRQTCPEIDKRRALDIDDWSLSFTKNNTISFIVHTNNQRGVVRAELPYECFCNFTVLADALYKDRMQKAEIKRAEECAKEKQIRYNKFLELKKEFEPAT